MLLAQASTTGCEWRKKLQKSQGFKKRTEVIAYIVHDVLTDTV